VSRVALASLWERGQGTIFEFDSGECQHCRSIPKQELIKVAGPFIYLLAKGTGASKTKIFP
jgi:hypothetical protein